MKIIRWHGRGGQGAFTAARLLGAAYSSGDNRYALAFPSFGPERRGAPVQAFTKLDSKPIGDRSESEKADYSIFLDDTLFFDAVFSELKPEGKILLNTKQAINNERIITLDGDAIAAEILKLPITNTIMLGAFAAVYGGITLDSIEEAIRGNMPEKLHKKNIAAVKAAAEALGTEAAL
ncbi:pyruvate ferredoxin oxidoreductase gamma subunit [Ruminiclostridium sufflavum DSM 19573]|uniref:Pyruvate ferredoxin oxidoreductase gamma subunit n=1 Tax=Ruminiclostridium sufflavum DSM 19573 TaxID=1121337 RepID=A0A318YAG4_9FIRM|nr:2-oxoacid:acceptor oxidoreductase family protein [Ruminiclostridium sufflavum]PYG89453.1 pyruvate ferredoxin oxidoreductase gamma subunit [Ruminiclostridium sufflavum DSM 19573]